MHPLRHGRWQVTAREGLWRITRDVQDACVGWMCAHVPVLDLPEVRRALASFERDTERVEQQLPFSQVPPPFHAAPAAPARLVRFRAAPSCTAAAGMQIGLQAQPCASGTQLVLSAHVHA